MPLVLRHHYIVAIAAIAVSTFCGMVPAHAVTVVDDTTEVSYKVPAGPNGSFADFPVVRKFAGEIQSIKVEVVSGNADDIGFVGNIRVTDIKPSCRGVGSVLGPINVTSQVTVAGDTASFVLRAQENCCCFTGWGPAVFHWQVTIADSCELDDSGACGECEGHSELADEAKASFKVDATTSCPANLGGGKLGLDVTLSANGSLSAANCGSDCKGKLEIGGSVSGIARMCGLRSAGVSGGFTYKEDRQYGKTCNQETCEEECDFTKSCISSEAAGRLGVTTGSTIRQNFMLRPPGTRSIFVTARCNVNLSLRHQLEHAAKIKSPAGLDCENCDERIIEYSLNGTAGGGCLIGLNGFGRSFDFGCNDCVELSAEGSISGTRRTGPGCVGGACISGSVKASGTLKAPEHCLSLFGYVVKAQLNASATGTCKADSCGESGCELKAAGAMDFTTQVGGSCD